MMTRWYKAFRCAGIQPDTLIKQIRFQVQQQGLANLVPVVRVEKRKYRKHQSGEYYLFLALESPNPGQIPPTVQSIFQFIPALSCPVGESLTLEQIKPMVRAEYELVPYDNVHLIPYKPPPPPPRSNPFEQTDDTPLPNSNDDLLLRSRSYDRLLLWLSAVGHGSWRIFQNTCQELGLVRERNTPATILRRLRLSGHIETSSNRNHWSVAPSVLVKRECTDNGNEYFLCGARDAHLVQQLWEIAEVSEELQVYGHAPARISLQVDDIERVQEHCSGSVNGLHIGGNVAYRLAQRLPPLADWMDTLEALSGISPYQFITRMLTGTGFEEKPFDASESGMYELWSDEPPAPSSQSSLVRPDYTLFYDAEKQRWLRGDWYGLRFLALQLSQMSQSPCSVRYEPSSGQLAIYQDERWPELYERVLVLASGKLPRYQEQWLIYESISQRILDALIPKLNLKMIGENHYA